MNVAKCLLYREPPNQQVAMQPIDSSIDTLPLQGRRERTIKSERTLCRERENAHPRPHENFQALTRRS